MMQATRSAFTIGRRCCMEAVESGVRSVASAKQASSQGRSTSSTQPRPSCRNACCTRIYGDKCLQMVFYNIFLTSNVCSACECCGGDEIANFRRLGQFVFMHCHDFSCWPAAGQLLACCSVVRVKLQALVCKSKAPRIRRHMHIFVAATGRAARAPCLQGACVHAPW